MASLRHFVDLLWLFSIALISLALSIQLVHAQTPFTPIPAGESGSVFIEGKAFYIQSGVTNQGITQQTFSISLSSSWTTLKPAYTKLPNGIYDHRFPNTLLSDGMSWFVVSNKTWLSYNINTGKITQHAPLTMYTGLLGLNAVVDQGSSEVVIPNGYLNGVRSTTLYITPFNLTTRTDSEPAQGSPLPADLSALVHYSLAWSQSAQKAILFGGVRSSGYSAALYQRNSMTWGGWYPIATTGGPAARESACMVPAFNGTKLILFGGSATLDVPFSDIFIYDVATATWSPGTDAGPKRARSAHACAVSGDALIVWGGYSSIGTRTPPEEIIAIYNLTTRLWVDTYNPPIPKQFPTSISTPTSPKPTNTGGSGSGSEDGPDPTPTPSGSGNNTGAIVGGSVAAVIVLAGLGFALWRRNRLKKCESFSDVHHRQINDGSLYYKEPTEKNRDPHAGPGEQSGPEPANAARHPQMDKQKQQFRYISETQPAYGLNNPQSEMPQHHYNYGAEMQSAYGARHPQSEIPQEHADIQPEYGMRHPQVEVPQHGHGHHQQNNEGYYDFKDPFAGYNNPHGDPSAQSAPRIPPRPVKGLRHPQLDISQRERELVAEMEMLRMDRGKAPVLAQHTDRWSIDRSGGVSYHA